MPAHPKIMEIARWIWSAARGYRWLISSVSLMGLLRVAASLTFVWISKVLIDTATSASGSESTMWWLAAALAVCMFLEMAFSVVGNYVGAISNQKFVNATRLRIFRILLQSDLYTDTKHTGDMLNRLTIDVNKIGDTLTSVIPGVLVMAVQLVGAFWMLCVMNPLLALCAVLITPIAKLVSHAYVKRVRGINTRIREAESRIHANVQEGLQHRIVVQTLDCMPTLADRVEAEQSRLYGDIIGKGKLSVVSRSAMRAGLIVGYLIAFVWSAFELRTGAITFGIMTAFLQLVARIQMPISSLSSSFPALVDSLTAGERLMVLDPEPSTPVKHDLTDPSEATSKPHSSVGVKISGLDFSYPPRQDGEPEAPIFSDFSCDFAPGSRSVIMGETGVGKSTLTKLILALLKPQKGSITFYGVDPDGSKWQEEASSATRRLITYVPQGNSLLAGTIRDNLLLGNAKASDQQIREALTIAVAEFVYDLPEGVDTQCGELGARLSEGQCQRIAIARALLKDSPVLILDEFNSSLDQDTASALMDNLIQARPDSTLILISHRHEASDYCNMTLRLS